MTNANTFPSIILSYSHCFIHDINISALRRFFSLLIGAWTTWYEGLGMKQSLSKAEDAESRFVLRPVDTRRRPPWFTYTSSKIRGFPQMSDWNKVCVCLGDKQLNKTWIVSWKVKWSRLYASKFTFISSETTYPNQKPHYR